MTEYKKDTCSLTTNCIETEGKFWCGSEVMRKYNHTTFHY